jgi:hypothetical protein
LFNDGQKTKTRITIQIFFHHHQVTLDVKNSLATTKKGWVWT